MAADLHKRGVGNNVGVGEEELSPRVHNKTAAGLALLLLLLPWNEEVGEARVGVDLDR